MSWLSGLRHRLLELLRPSRADRDLDDELRDHLVREVERQVAAGMPVGEARRTALVRAGSLQAAREAVRDARTGSLVADAMQDLRVGVRGLRRNPGFAAAVIISLALGVGGTTAMYAIVHAVLIRQLPYHDGARLFLMRVWWNSFSATLSNADLIAAAEQIGDLGSIAAYYRSDEGFTMATPAGPQVIKGGTMTARLPAVFGTAPIAGRSFSSDSAPETLIGDRLWLERFNRSPDAIGKPIVLDGTTYTIVGVMPRTFNLPGQSDGAAWIKATLKPPTRRGGFFLQGIVRLAPDINAEAAAARLTSAVTPVLGERYGVKPGWRYGLRPLRDTVVGGVQETLLLLLAAMGLVLLIAVVNVSNLLLARASTRLRELAVRASLGAGRGRLARQLLVESSILGGAGGILGLGLAWLGVGLARTLGAAVVPRLDEVSLDRRVVAFAVACGLTSGVLAGVLPALRVPWRHLLSSLGAADRSSAPGSGHGRTRQALVIAEMALTVTIVVAALLFAKSLFRLEAVDPGFRPDGVLTFRLSLPDAPYANEDRLSSFLNALDGRLRQLPGVSAAAFSFGLPPDLLPISNNYTLEGDVTGEKGVTGVAEWVVVSPGYFPSLGITLVRGRPFNVDDDGKAPPVAIVNERFAHKHFPDGRVLGRRLKGGDWDGTAPWTTIVGVAADVPYVHGVWGGADDTVYVAYAQNLWVQSPYVTVKSAAPIPSDAIRGAVTALDPDLPLRDVATMRERMRQSMLEPRLRSLLFALLAALALSLALTGIYGVMSYHVTQRRRETAIRRALGARAAEVVRATLFSGLRLAGVGIVLGSVGALALTKSLSTLLFHVSPSDPAILAMVATLLAACAVLACAIPALRTVRIDPASVLRDE
jgi:putative ABC transport system permease protein